MEDSDVFESLKMYFLREKVIHLLQKEFKRRITLNKWKIKIE